jgi:hypothetical protein
VNRNIKNPDCAVIIAQGAGIKTTATRLKQAVTRRSRGFVLWEIMLALTIFCVVAVSLTSAVHQIVDTSILLRDEAQVRLELQNLLTESVTAQIKPGRSEVPVGDGRVHYEKVIRVIQAKTALGVVLPNLYEIAIQGSWKASGQERSAHAVIIVYRP